LPLEMFSGLWSPNVPKCFYGRGSFPDTAGEVVVCCSSAPYLSDWRSRATVPPQLNYRVYYVLTAAVGIRLD